MDHVSNTNYYRKNLPAIFTGEDNADYSSILSEKLKTLTPVPLPIDLVRANQHKKIIVEAELKRLNRNNSSARNLDISNINESSPMAGSSIKRGSVSVRRNTINYKTSASPTSSPAKKPANYYEDETYLLRLKQKNYGKWYVKPEDYGRKIDLLKT